MLVLLATLWYFYATDLNETVPVTKMRGGFHEQTACEEFAEITHRFKWGVLVHLLTVRKTTGGQYQQACFLAEPEPSYLVTPTR